MDSSRVQLLNQAEPRKDADYVLYWSQMNRRVGTNHALAFACEKANEQNLPLLVYEGLTFTYEHANDRLHTFVLEGVPDTAKKLQKLGAGYCFYPRRKKSDANDVLYRLAAKAKVLVTDDYPTFIAAGHNVTVPDKIDLPYYAVDSSCIVPMARFEKREWAAYTIRPKIRRMLPESLVPVNLPKLKQRWQGDPPSWHRALTKTNVSALVAECDIDHSVPVSTSYRGGSEAGRKRLTTFLRHNLLRYARERNEPSKHSTSNLSPYLHFGHLSSLEVALETKAYAQEHGLIADEFLEELIVRRELAFNFTRFTPDHKSLRSLPEWAQNTMKAHAKDPRPAIYSAKQLEAGKTYDALWNATQKELLLRGKIHGYYRMYWGKKLIEWTAHYETALELMIYFHDRYSLDGRDPNTYTNVLWCFGLHDRPWGERPVFGKIRFMSTAGMERKTDTDAYIAEIQNLERGGKDPETL